MSRRSLDKRQRARARKQRKAEERARRRACSPPAPSANAAPPIAEPARGVEAQAIDAALRWHVARTRPRMGARTMDALAKAKVATVRPRTSEVVVRRGRRVIRRTPLVPRTVFVGVTDDHHLDQVRGLAGIAEIVSHAEPQGGGEGNVPGFVLRPARIDPAALQRFADALAAGEITQPVGVRVGQSVIVMQGPFASFPGTVEAILPGDRIKVGVAIFGRSSPCEMGLAEIQAVQ